MAQGLAAAHERGIVHRDLKPENVFITRDGHVKLLDFGIAKLVEAAQATTPHGLMDATVSPSGGSTGTGMVLGTPGYMSPEQVRGDPVDARTDFFSLGAVLYEMLCGHRAFPAGPVVESGYAILHTEPEPLPATRPAAGRPGGAAAAWRRTRGGRFQSARDLAFNLELLRTPTGSVLPTATTSVAPTRTARWRRWLWPLSAVLAVLAASGATYFTARAARPSMPSVEQVTFRRGRVSAARFSPEGRVVFSAAWDGQPLDVYSRAPGSPDAQPLGLRDAPLFGVSASGELAVSLRALPFGVADRGTLAVVPGSGGTPREIAENILWADWSPTDELAVVRDEGGPGRLEYPLGTPLFESETPIVKPRISPRGDAVAFMHQVEVREELMVVDRQRRARTLTTGEDVSGLAWMPNGEEVWFTDSNAIWASPLSGGRRLVYRGVSEMRLEDISREGRVLVNVQNSRWDIAFLPPEQQPERQLTVLDGNSLAALSDDGHQELFTASAGVGPPVTYIRPTDGSPPLKLGPGYALALSPDGKWVLTRPKDYRNVLSLLPVGPGAPRAVPVVGLSVRRARWLHGGKRLVFTGGTATDNKLRLYVMPVEGGTPVPISPPGVRTSNFEVSRDDRLVAIRGIDAVLTLYPLDGSPPVPLSELGHDVVPAGWTTEGQLWIRSYRGLPSRLFRYDVRSRRVLEERSLSPADSTGLAAIGMVCITPDSRAIAFDYERVLGSLYLLDGLAPGRR